LHYQEAHLMAARDRNNQPLPLRELCTVV
jgi:hypothetical protein